MLGYFLNVTNKFLIKKNAMHLSGGYYQRINKFGFTIDTINKYFNSKCVLRL